MKAVQYTIYGPPEVFKLKELEKPIPRNNELLVKVHATTVSSGVLWARNGSHPDSRFFTLMIRLMFGLLKPRKKILGYEFSGVVESVGNNVSLFTPGNQVYGTTTGLKHGAYAEYLCVPEEWKSGIVAKMPSTLSFNEAAAVPAGAITALQIIRKANIKEGDKILIYGASGSVGTYLVQLAKNSGADVTGVSSTGNLELIKSIGADKQIDYKNEDFTNAGYKYDIVVDAVGKISASYCKGVLTKQGRFLTVKTPTNEKTEYLTFISTLIESGKIRPVIDKIYSLDQMVEAHRYVDKGHKRGNVVITVE